MGKRHGMELSFNMIIIAILAAIILVVSILLLTRGTQTYTQTEKSLTQCGSGVLADYACTNEGGSGCLTVGCPSGQKCCPTSDTS